ncbi:MAG TPA: hypothetical protein VF808_07500 [Ktedonobacterales bacterium]
MRDITRFALPTQKATRILAAFAVTALALALVQTFATRPVSAATAGVAPNAVGGLDCNGFSPIQRPVKVTGVCADPHGFYDGRANRFEDNGHYIGHDEPSLRFLSSVPGSGNDVTWSETLPADPAAAPTVANPGSDVTHWVELSIAPWFAMALCDPYSYPQTACKPESDANAPGAGGSSYIGGGSSFLEVQFYPPGMAPFVDNISCDNSHWCASLHINDLECTLNFHHCNNNCVEPTNFAFIQMDGIPTGPPSPQLSNLATSVPNAQTLLMSAGDKLKVHIFDASAPGGGRALEVRIDDLTSGQSGFMQASAANGYMATLIGNCHGVPFNYQPEYNTASPQNLVPWAALEGGILTEYEIGHFTPCTSLSDPVTLSGGGLTDTTWLTCNGPYEANPDGLVNPNNPEFADGFCYPAGDTHGGFADPNVVTGCLDFSPGDLDYDGTPYYPDWPNSVSPTTFPSTFLQSQPTSNGARYPQVQFETDAPATESTCGPATLAGCAVPPPGGPGNFYPYFTQASVGGQCVWEFGQMPNGNAFGGAAQYGAPSAYFFGTLASQPMANPNCS